MKLYIKAMPHIYCHKLKIPNTIMLKGGFTYLKSICKNCVCCTCVYIVSFNTSSQRCETWRRNVAARVNSSACCPRSWTSFGCRPPKWTWPALAYLIIPASLFWPMGWAWLLSEVSHAIRTLTHTRKEHLRSQENIRCWVIKLMENS